MIAPRIACKRQPGRSTENLVPIINEGCRPAKFHSRMARETIETVRLL